jgi:FixJ family two-component response regulator
MKTAKRVVAIVEDDASMSTSIARLLRIHGFIAEIYNSAEEFLDSLAASKASCALVDVNLGGLSGIELCERLTASGRISNVIVMTAMDNKGNRERAIKAGCSEFLHKPFAAHSLIEAIEQRPH